MDQTAARCRTTALASDSLGQPQTGERLGSLAAAVPLIPLHHVHGCRYVDKENWATCAADKEQAGLQHLATTPSLMLSE